MGTRVFEKMTVEAAKEAAGEAAPADLKGSGTFSGKAPEKEPDPKPKRKQPYRARIHTPQMLALGSRASLLLLDLSPLILAQWKYLVERGTDPRRLGLEAGDSKIAALLPWAGGV